jgi:hypothetical protein
MAFFKSKEDNDRSQLPELPGLPEMPQLPSLPGTYNKTEVRPLPTFPKTSLGESMGIGAIKSTLDDNSEKDFETRRIGPAEKRTMELSEMNNSSTRSPIKSVNKEPVFIKLDRFQDAVKKFEEIKIKVKDIEDSLGKIREIKDKEEEELKSWEQEIQMIKNNVSNIDNSLFSKL